jgi:phage terminase large subunit-like protein
MQTLKGPWAGRPLRFLEWEKLVIQELFEGDEAGNRYRQGLVGVGRQNGKSIIGSGLAVEALFRGPVGSEIYSAAGDRQQARVVFGEAKRQIASTPRLAAQAKVYRDAIEIPSTGSVYRVLSSDAKLQQGLSPYFVVFDEVHVQRDDELWNAMAFGMAARPGSVLLGITTAGDHEDSLCGRLYEYGRLIASGEVDDPSFFFMWWEPAEENVDIFDRDGWRQANPALLEGVLNEEELEQSARRSSPAAFRRYRLNQWVSHGGDRWMDMQAWDECVDEDLTLKTGDPIVLAFDGSVDEDATALAAFRLDKDVPRLAKLWVWERQPTDPDTWQVDRLDVDAVVRECFAEYRVKAMGCDPAYWRSEIQEWQVQFGRKVLEWPVTNARMGPACTEVYKRVKDGDFAHNGDPTLRRHVRNAITKPTPGGHVTIRKQTPKSEHKIDAAVTVCIGVDLWTRYATGSRVLRTF